MQHLPVSAKAATVIVAGRWQQPDKMGIMDFKIIREIFNITDDSFGFSEIEIEKTEKRLSIKFPEILREYYQKLGNHQKLNQTQDTLLSLDRIKIDENGFLIFYAENQYVAIWGIKYEDLKEMNPSVYRKDVNGWELDSEKLSIFLNSMAFMQAIFSLSYHANSCGIEAKYDKIVIESFKEIGEEFSLWNVKFYRNLKTELIAVFRNDRQTDIFVAAKNKNDFESVLDKFDFEWDYHSERDN